jgi:hypothetical protein
MAGFAQLNENNVIIDIVVISDDDILDDNGNLSEELGVERIKSLLGQDTRWVIANKQRVARIGDTYDHSRNAFIYKKPFPSWILNEDTLEWDAPTPIPGENYVWNEETLTWDSLENPVDTETT